MNTPKRKRGNPQGQPVNDRLWTRPNRSKSAKRKLARDKKRKSYNPNHPSRRPINRKLLIDTHLSDEQIPTAKALVLEQICEHGSPTTACIHAGVGRRTFYEWLHESDGTFRKAYVEARKVWRASAIADTESAFALRAQWKDTLAGIFLLKHNTKRYREVNRLQLSGPDGGPILTADVKELLVQRLAKLVERAEVKPKLIAGSVEVHAIESSPAVGVRKAGSAGSAGSRKGRGVSYG